MCEEMFPTLVNRNPRSAVAEAFAFERNNELAGGFSNGGSGEDEVR